MFGASYSVSCDLTVHNNKNIYYIITHVLLCMLSHLKIIFFSDGTHDPRIPNE